MKPLQELLGGMRPPVLAHACPACGAPLARPGPCPTCEDAGRTARDATAATATSIPARFASLTGLDAPDLALRVDRRALDQARGLPLRTLDRVTLLGAAGSGKSSLAVAIARAWVAETARPALFCAAVDLGTARQQHGLGEGEARLVRQAMSAALLLLDDLGQELPAGTPAVAHVLQHRYDRMKPTVVTTGLPVETLLARYGAGVGRRLLETAGGAVVLRLAAPPPSERAPGNGLGGRS